ncbi:hypothetical protein F4806DRAFT_165944 [Annulohypoxylon nitens]|nr:hypothetical protein F4806DRAFT_165944 [Annulohypoxylon nitens]
MTARSRGSEKLLAVILRHRRDLPITENLLIQAARNQHDGDRAMKVLVEHASGTIQISAKVLYAASSNRELSWPILDYIFGSLKEEINMSEDVMVMIAAQSLYPMNFFKALFKHRQETRITKAVIMAIAKNKWISRAKGEGEIELLLSHGHKISLTEDVLVAILRNPGFGLKTMNHLLQKEQAINITTRIVSTALMTVEFRLDDDRRHLESFLDRCPDSCVDIEAAANNKRHGYEVICMIQNCKSDMKIGNRVVEAAAGNNASGRRILESIFEHAPGMEISDRLLEITAKKGNAKGLDLLLDRIDKSRITDELLNFLLRATVSCAEPCTYQVVKEILDRINITFPISEDILITAFRIPIPQDRKHFSPIHVLLNGDRPAVVTEKVLEAAVKNCYDISCLPGSVGHIKLLLEKNENLSVPERFVVAAIANREMSEASFESLLDRAQCRITYEMLRRAAETDHDRRHLLYVFLRRQNDLEIDFGILEAAARNEYYPGNAFKTLLKLIEGTILTENILIAAAQSSGESMGAILSNWKHDIQVSPAVLEAVASNERWEFFSIMQIILHRYGDIEITEDVLEAARNNKTMRSVLTALLRKHQKQHNLSTCDNDEWPYGLDTLFRNYE